MTAPSNPMARPVTAAVLGLLISAFPLSAAADTSPSYLTTTLFIPASYFPGPGYRSTYASVIGADASATTYRLDCTDGRWGDEEEVRGGQFDKGCEDWPSVTLTAGPSTAQVMASAVGEKDGVQETQGMACKVDSPAAQAICDFITYGDPVWTGHYPLYPITGTELVMLSQAVTITEGMDKLPPTASTTSHATATASITTRVAGGDDTPKTTTGSEASTPGAQATGPATGKFTSGSAGLMEPGRAKMGAVVALAVALGLLPL